MEEKVIRAVESLKKLNDNCYILIDDLTKSAYQDGYVEGSIEQEAITKKETIKKFKKWLEDNPNITYDENNRIILKKLLKAFTE